MPKSAVFSNADHGGGLVPADLDTRMARGCAPPGEVLPESADGGGDAMAREMFAGLRERFERLLGFWPVTEAAGWSMLSWSSGWSVRDAS